MPPWSSPLVDASTATTTLSDRRSVARSRVWRGHDGARRLGGAPGSGDVRAHGEGAPGAEGLGRRAGRGRRGRSAPAADARRAGARRRGVLALCPDFNLLVLGLN
jgi:hypothetical protein